MENKDQNTPASSTIVNPAPQGSGASFSAENQNSQTPISSPLNEANPLDAPIVPSENSLETSQTPTQNFAQTNSSSVQITPNNNGQPPKKGFNKVFLVIGGIAVLILLAVIVTVNLLSKRQASQLQSPAQSVNEQGITLGSATPDTLTALQLEGSQNKLIVNGDIIVNGRLAVASGEFFGQFVVNNLTANRSYTLPDADGTICLDTNNCNYATSGNEVNSINGVNGILTLGEGLGLQGTTIVNTQNELTVNEVISSIVFQGTNNQVGITKNGNVISFTTPQDIAVASSPTFNSITLTVAGTQNGNEICDISNNCGYAGGTNAFVQNGNSFGETAVLGTNDDFDLSFETYDTVRMTIDADTGHIGIGTVAGDSTVLNLSGTVTEDGYGFRNLVGFDAASPITSATGTASTVFILGSAEDYTAVTGTSSTVVVSSASDITSLMGSYINVSQQGGGVIGSVYGQLIGIDDFGGGSITNAYGLYIEDQTGIATGNNYNIYSAGNGYNLFEGHVGVGNASTSLLGTATLSVVDTITTSGVGIANAIQVNALAGNGDNTALLNELNTIGAQNYDSSVGLQSTIRNGSTGTTDTAVAIGAQILNESTGTITIATGVGVGSLVNSGGGTVLENYGIYVQGQLAATDNYGIRIDTADTQTLWLAGNEGTASTGIGFGSTRDVNLYRSAANVLRTDSAFSIGTLAATDNASYLCLNSGGIIAGCSGTATGAAFVQGGNDFGGTAILGTIGANSLVIQTNNQPAITIASGGAVTFQNATDSANGFQILDQDGGLSILSVDTINERVSIGGVVAPVNKLEVFGSTSLYGSGPSVLTGSIDATASTAVVGVGTLFTTELRVGDRITVSGETRYVTAITDDTHLTVANAFTDTAVDTSVDRTAAIFSANNPLGGNEFVVDQDVTTAERLQLGVTNGYDQCYTIVGPLACDSQLEVINGSTSGTNSYGIYTNLYALSSGANAAANVASYNSLLLGGTGGTYTSTTNAAVYASAIANTTGGSHASLAALQGVISVAGTTTVTNGYGLLVQSASSTATLTNNYGALIQDQTAGTNDYGLAIAGADTYALWLGSGADNTDAANGITFGLSGDTNLYRSAANTLKTDDSLLSSKLGVNTSSFGTNEVLRVNTPTTVDNATAASIATGGTANKGLIIQGAASQTANLQEWQNSSGTVLASIGPAGRLTVNPTTSTSTAAATDSAASITFSDTGIVNSGTDDTRGLSVTVNRTGATGGTITTYGISSQVNGDTGGTSTAYGIGGGAHGADSNAGVFGFGQIVGTESTTTTAGVYAVVNTLLGGGGSTTNAYALQASIGIDNGAATYTTAAGLNVSTATNISGGTITTNYGIKVDAQTAGTSDYGIRVDAADTQTLWISGNADNTTASAGIAFGASRDTNLYRSAADTLKTDDSLEVTNKLQIGTSGGTLAQCGGVIGLFTCNNTLEQASSSTETTVQTYGANFVTGVVPAGATNTVENRAVNAVLGLYGTQSFSSSSGNYAIAGTAVNATTAGTVALLGGVSGTSTQGGAGSTITEAFGLQGNVAQTSGTLTTGYGVRILTATGTIGTNYGIHVQTQTAGTSDYGIRVDAADTQTLWVSGNADNTTAAAGIAFGSSRDTNLYRSAADTLKTDDSLQVTNNVGIGVAPGSYKLDVNTDAASYVANFFNDGNDQNRYGIRIQAGADDGSGTTYYLDAYDGDGSQVGYIANTSGTFALTDVSDVRTKTNIVDTSVDALNVLSGLRVVDFNRLQNPDGPLITGFIAQEVQGVYSQAVTTGANGLLGVAKEAFIPVLVKGIQQQQGQITALTNQVGSLQNIDGRLVALEQQVDDLSVPQNQGSTFANLNVSGTAVLQNLTVTGDTSIASLTVTGNAYIAGNITLHGHVLGNADTRGSVTVPAGQTEFKQTFQRRYTAGSQPNVILTPKNTFAPNYRVESTDTDFTVYFEAPAAVDVIMNYQVQE